MLLRILVSYEDEKEYLSTKFDPGDSERPYVKIRHGEVTSNGKMQRYIHRCRVPFWIEIKEI